MQTQQKGRVFADQLKEFPSSKDRGVEPEFPDEGIFLLEIEAEKKWQLFCVGASNKRGNAVGMMLVDLEDERTPIAIKLDFTAKKIIAE